MRLGLGREMLIGIEIEIETGVFDGWLIGWGV